MVSHRISDELVKDINIVFTERFLFQKSGDLRKFGSDAKIGEHGKQRGLLIGYLCRDFPVRHVSMKKALLNSVENLCFCKIIAHDQDRKSTRLNSSHSQI